MINQAGETFIHLDKRRIRFYRGKEKWTAITKARFYVNAEQENTEDTATEVLFLTV